MALNDIDVSYLLECLYLQGKVLPYQRICLFVFDIYNFDGNFLFVGFVDASEDITSFGEIKVIIKSIRVMLYFLPKLIS